MSQHLPGIIAIDCVPCSALPPHLVRRACVGLPVAIRTTTYPVTFFGTPLCEVQTEYEARAYSQTATLSFVTDELLPDETPLAFVITTAQGGCFLIGSAEQPYPVIAQTASTGVPASTKAAIQVEITCKSACALVPCLL